MAGHTSWGNDHRAQWLTQAIQSPEPGGGGSDAEAYYGNVQIEIGSNTDIKFKGKNDANAHLGLCMLNCSLYLDDEPIIESGEFVPDEMKRRS
jgi:2,5-dihydroxypyridine 5,6-dioxygenase